MSTLDVFDMFSRDYARERFEVMSLRDWLLAARDDKMFYASPAERMVSAIGEPELIDTAQDTRLGRMFFNRTIKRLSAPSKASSAWKTRSSESSATSSTRHRGSRRSGRYFISSGPVGGGKSSLAERLKELMEKHPIYVLKAGDEISPVFESPLGLFRSGPIWRRCSPSDTRSKSTA